MVMTAGRRAIALMAVGILAAGIWQVAAPKAKPVAVAGPVMNVETENRRVVAAPGVRAAAKKLSPVRLVAFDSCTRMLQHLRAKARPMVTAWGLGLGPYSFHGDVVVRGRTVGGATGAPGAPVPMRAPMMMAADEDYSTTNIQEAGVDEPDLVKTDGRTLYSLSHGRLYAVDVAGKQARILGSVGIAGADQQMLLAGDRLMVFSNEYNVGASVPSDLRSLGHVAVAIVNVADPARMFVIDRVRVEGSLVSARLVDGVARVVTRSNPVIAVPQASLNTSNEVKAAERRNRGIVGRAGIDRWLPDYTVEHGGRTVDSGVAVPCNRVSRPMIFAGLGMTTVLTIDPKSPKPQDASSVNADAEVVYATRDNLYVAAGRWLDPALRRGVSLMSTQIHKFDISGSGPARYLASGEVRGRVLKQWSLSEHEGFLRVATTDNGTFGLPTSESYVVVMQQRGDVLTRISAVRGLGKGESIQGVRFMGDRGYVVTFRIIDPLYVLDLRNPWRPQKTGKLKVPGYSAYLHPVGKDRLLGIGRGGTSEGRITGIKAALYDVSNPAEPREIASRMLNYGGSTPVEWDHHAFLWWPKTKLAFIPMWNESAGIRIDGDELVDLGRVSHTNRARDPMYEGSIQRAVIIHDALLTISNFGLLESDAKTLAERAWVGWAS
jgi:uncharacterized secreted protein with C-terminal beta-propeller domain